MSLKQTIPLFFIFFLVIAGCDDNAGNSAINPFAGSWVKSQSSFVDEDEITHIGLQVSEEGIITEISTDDTKHGFVVGKVSPDGKVGLDTRVLKEMSENPKLEITSFTMRMKTVDENQISLQVTSVSGFYDGKPLEGMSAGEPDFYNRISNDGVETARTERLDLIRKSEELIESLIGSSWELVRKYVKSEDLSGSFPEYNYEHTFEAKYLEEKQEYETWTSYNFKSIRFLSETELDINNGMFVSEFDYHPVKGLMAQDTQGISDYLKSNFGTISVNGDELVMSLDTVDSYTSERDGVEREVKNHRIEIRTYKRVQ